MRQLVIIGTGDISYAVSHYINTWGEREIAGYAVDQEYVGDGTFLGKSVASIDKITSVFPPDVYYSFVAIGYQDNNSLRRDKMLEVEAMGYSLVNVINPQAPSDLKVGKNCFVASSEHIQPGVTLLNNVFIWSGALIGHHTSLSNHSWISGGASIGGSAKIGERTFVGIGATIGHKSSIGMNCIIGAGTLITKDLDDNSVLIERDTEVYRMNSEQFLRFSRRFSK